MFVLLLKLVTFSFEEKYFFCFGDCVHMIGLQSRFSQFLRLLEVRQEPTKRTTKRQLTIKLTSV